MLSKYVKPIFIILCFILLIVVNSAWSKVPVISYGKAKKIASSYASQMWGVNKAGKGTVFVDPDDNPVLYMFTIYCGKDNFPTEKSIIKQVAAARTYRLEGEAIFGEWIKTKKYGLYKNW